MWNKNERSISLNSATLICSQGVDKFTKGHQVSAQKRIRAAGYATSLSVGPLELKMQYFLELLENGGNVLKQVQGC